MLLAERIAAEPEPRGDATLVIRTQNFPDGKSIPGHDLYLDDGRYYYGSTKGELKDAALNSRYHEPLVKAAIAAPDLPPAEARHKMDLALGDGNAPKVERSVEDNHVWVGSMDALLAGAGRKDVRAGVMTLLATIDAVTVTEEASCSSSPTRTSATTPRTSTWTPRPASRRSSSGASRARSPASSSTTRSSA